MDVTEFDPKGLIRESYLIEGITDSECRSIFVDWAIQIPVDADPKAHIQASLDFYSQDQAGHPMTQVLTAGLAASPPKKRRGGRSARVPQTES